MAMLEGIEPNGVFYFFEEISKIPRGSGNERAISDYMVNFAQSRGLECIQDKANNILIRKAGTQGYENSPILIIQGHIDMVCEKNSGTIHDFLCDPLKLRIDGDFISAEGTTLGADNGIAIAYALALLDSNTIPHPPLEIIMTTDEEVGMGGAAAFDTTQLKGRRFINIDTEEEGKLLVSCCGGVRATITLPVKRVESPVWGIPYIINIKGLKGGHSGADIHLQRANANKLMGRTLLALTEVYDVKIASVNGGSMDNAICRETEAVVLVKSEDIEGITKLISDCEKTYLHEYKNCDKGITVKFERLNESVVNVFDDSTAKNVVDILILIPYGVVTMSLDIKGLVESSTNLGIVKTTEDSINFASAVRSCVASKKYVIYNQLKQLAHITGGELSARGDYPAWEFNPQSELLDIFKNVYKNMYGVEAEVEAIHAGLECGLFGERVKGMDMISMGPNMFDVHTPDERLSISSTGRVWEFLKEVLKSMK